MRIEQPSDGGGGTLAFEIPSGSINGSNVTFTVSNTPAFVTLNGAVITLDTDYTHSGGTITMTVAPPTDSILRSYYN